MAKATSQRINQGIHLQSRGKITEAEQIYQQILATDPENAHALHLLGTVALHRRDFERSTRLISQAISRLPNQALFHHNLGAALRAVGQFDKAREQYQTALHLRPNYAEALFNLSSILRGNDPEAPLDTLETLLAQPNVKREDRCFLHFAAGKWYDDRGEYDRAFFHYREGNALCEDPFDPDAIDRYVDELMAVFDRETLTQRRSQGFESDLPVFIIGMPRSGTTLVEQVLSAHPQVFGAGELSDLNSIARTLPQHVSDHAAYPACVRFLSDRVLNGFGKALVNRLQQLNSHAPRIVDKYPPNFFHAGLITLLLPQARIIHCRRNALDTCLSCFFQRFRSNHQAFSNNLIHLGRYYRAYDRLMDHWRSALPTAMFELDYETMVTDQEATCRKLIDFLELPWSDNCLQAHKMDRPVITASQLQVRQPVYRSSVKRWQHYENHLAPLRTALEERASG